MEFDLKSILRIIRLENVIKCCMCLLAACMRVLHDVVLCVCNQLFAQFCPMANGAHLMRFNANRTFRDANNILQRERKRNNASWCYRVSLGGFLRPHLHRRRHLFGPTRHLSFVVQLIMLKC